MSTNASNCCSKEASGGSLEKPALCKKEQRDITDVVDNHTTKSGLFSNEYSDSFNALSNAPAM